MKSGIQLELCCADIHSVQLAELYKVDAVELCMDLLSGGLTPSSGAVKKARNLFSGKIRVEFEFRQGDLLHAAVIGAGYNIPSDGASAFNLRESTVPRSNE